MMRAVLSGTGTVLADFAVWGGMAILVLGLLRIVYVPLAVFFEARAAWQARRHTRRHRRRRTTMLDSHPVVSVIIPAFNEERVLVNCVRSILAADYDRVEVVIVDDGSTDHTADVAQSLAAAGNRVRAVTQANAGKGAALNRGIAESAGDVFLFVDADGIFDPATIREMLRGFDDPRVGAVCGDDRPVNLNRPATQLLAVLSHVGTGLVRRALVLLHCLPIVSGNIGAFPRSVIEQIGGFHSDTLGEDLELTWRVHKAGYRVNFRPTALVYAESPSTLRGLWRQRVRWARGLLQTLRIHRRMVGNPRYGSFGLYLLYNAVAMVVVPILQLFVLALLPIAISRGESPVAVGALPIIGWLGLWLSLVLVVVAICLNRAWHDFRFLWSVVLWPFYSVAMCAVMVAAIISELGGAPARWNKLDRTGVISRAQCRQYASVGD